MSKITVLDKGFVRYIDHMGSDLTVCNAARVSFAKETEWEFDEEAINRLRATGSGFHMEDMRKLSEKDQKLIKYLATHNHWTPFAHPQICLHIKAPISIRTQLFKHKIGFVENEVSRRYVKDEPEFYVPRWRGAPTNGAKQGSSDFLVKTASIEECYHNIAEDAIECYNNLLDNGVAPEQARFVLPQGTYTEWWWTGSLASYARVFKLRTDPHAQWEVQQYADAIGKIIAPLFVESWKSLTT